MSNKPNIAVVVGGNSSEFIVSVKSGANIFNAVDTTKFTPWIIQIKGEKWEVFKNEEKIANIDKSDFSFGLKGEKITFAFAYITIHGTPGEDGILQAYFDLIQIPYSTGNVHSSSLTFNKWFCNNYLRSFGIKMANSLKITKNDKIDSVEIASKLKLPLFIKPNAGGSSFGITKVKTVEEILPAIKKAQQESNEVLIEQFIDGQEFTCGVIQTGDEKIVLPVTEIITENEFFDFDAKYRPGAANEITPARLSESQTKQCQRLSSKIYDLCECSGIARIDFILMNNEFYFLEVNTTPGMTETSFIPQQIEAMQLTLKGIITRIIEAKLN